FNDSHCLHGWRRSGQVGAHTHSGGIATRTAQSVSGTLLAKRLQVARELMPADALLAALMNPAGPENDSDLKDLQDAARIIGQRLAIVNGTAKLEFLPVGFSGARSPLIFRSCSRPNSSWSST